MGDSNFLEISISATFPIDSLSAYKVSQNKIEANKSFPTFSLFWGNGNETFGSTLLFNLEFSFNILVEVFRLRSSLDYIYLVSGC